MTKNKSMYITYASMHLDGSPTVFYVVDLNVMPVTEMLEIMGINYIKVVKSQNTIFWRCRTASHVEPLPIGLN